MDQRFSRHAMVTLLSVLRANPAEAFHFHFISFDPLTFDDVLSAVSELRSPRCAITSYQAPPHIFAALPESPHFPKSACLRLLAPFLLRGCGRVLYLDADIVCLGPVRPLWDAVEHSEQIVAVVEDCAETVDRQVAALGLEGRRYFNSGMLCIDIPRWLEGTVTEQVLTILQVDGGYLRFPDQDALNQVLEGRSKYVAGCYNQQFTLAHEPQDEVRRVPSGTVLLHYSGVDKPWQAWNEQAAVVHYRRLRASLPWAGEALDMPRTGRQARRMYKLCFRRKRLLKGCYWLAVRWKAARKPRTGR
ncbi:hypothetical protein G7016_15620 [Pseudomonas japonica]|nr:hypothetical protein [Pseudomonas japonica]